MGRRIVGHDKAVARALGSKRQQRAFGCGGGCSKRDRVRGVLVVFGA